MIHHGYLRATEDIDLLVAADTVQRLDMLPPDLIRVGRRRLQHAPTEVDIDLLVAGDPIPRAQGHRYPEPSSTATSPTAADVIALPGLLELKLRARRYQDLADVVQLLKRLDDAEYLGVDARLPSDLRPDLAQLRDDALEEMRDG